MKADMAELRHDLMKYRLQMSMKRKKMYDRLAKALPIGTKVKWTKKLLHYEVHPKVTHADVLAGKSIVERTGRIKSLPELTQYNSDGIYLVTVEMENGMLDVVDVLGLTILEMDEKIEDQEQQDIDNMFSKEIKDL